MSKIYKINNHLMEYKSNCIDYKENPNPLNLPANTIRVKFKSGYTPTMGNTQTLVDGTNNIWDIYKQSNDWTSLFSGNSNLLEILGANTTSITKMKDMFSYCNITSVPLFDTSKVTNMMRMFYSCSSLQFVPLFDTSKVTNMAYMFMNCTALQSVPLLDTSKVTTMEFTFNGCTNVQSGALALYQQASSQANPPSNHYETFYICGYNTTQGKAELAQIPSDWK